jgi:transposase
VTRSLKVRKPTAAEFRQLNEWVEEADQPWKRRRASVVAYYALGLNAREIAGAVGVHPNTVYAVLHAFDRRGLATVREPPSPGAPERITSEKAAEICRLADMPPGELGLEEGRWSLANLRTYLIRTHVVKRISREHLRRLLKKGGSISAAFGGN